MAYDERALLSTVTSISHYEKRGEAAYEAMYDARDRNSVKPHFEDACTFFSQAIAEAERLNQPTEVARLTQRRAHIRAVYDSQFR